MFGAEGGFDIIIGNPPYVFTRKGDFSDNFKKLIKDKYLSNIIRQKKTKANQAGKINLFGIFILNGIEQLNNLACIAFIIPNNLLRTTTYELIRKGILDHTQISEIVDLGSGIFEQVTASTILIRLIKNNYNEKNKLKNIIKVIHNIKSLEAKKFDINYIKQYRFITNTSYSFNIYSDERTELLFQNLKSKFKPLGSYCKDIIEGIVAHKHLISETYSEDRVPLLEGKNIKRFEINEAKNYLLWDKKQIHRPRPDYLWDSENKILVQRISGGSNPLVAALDTQKHKTFASINNIILNKSYSNLYIYITSLLNSKLLNFYYANNFLNKSELTVNISKTYLEQLPIVNVLDEKLLILENLVDNIVKSKNKGLTINTKVFELRLNLIIFKLYELSYSEVQIIYSEIEKLISQKDYESKSIEELAEYEIKL